MKISNPIGLRGEDIATDHLKKKGYKILERNFRKGYGEIDIIALQGRTLIFIEVKTRTTEKFGTPLEQITSKKLNTLKKTAEYYKISNSNLPDAMRLDAIAVMLDNYGNVSNIEHVENIGV